MTKETKAVEATVETTVAPPAVIARGNVTKRERKLGTNALTLPWPRDPQGALSELKRGGTRAAARVGGHKDKLKALIETLDIIKEHAIAKYKVEIDAKRVGRENALAARARVLEQRAKNAEARAQEYEEAAARVRKAGGVKEAE